jgi:molybdopterin synthase sulfur carrier subunit
MQVEASTVKALFFGRLRQVFKTAEAEITLNDDPSIRALLNRVCSSPERHQKIFDELGVIRPELTILRNGRNICLLDGIETRLEEGDQVAIFPPVYGG